MKAPGLSSRTRLDRFISSHAGVTRGAVRALLASGRVEVNGRAASEINQVVDQFSHITLDGQVLQDRAAIYLMLNKPRGVVASGTYEVNGRAASEINQVVDQFSHITLDGQVLQDRAAIYLMLNKPRGVVSATRDEKHRTVIDLLDANTGNDLHIAGRLDFNSTGLLLLTNDGRWSRRLASAHNPVEKVYRVTVEHALTEHYIEAFAQGMYFPYENITTRPVTLTILSDYSAELRLTEGRYHQIKRMFGRFNNKVLTLHRIAIGNVSLDPGLTAGQYRPLTQDEVDGVC